MNRKIALATAALTLAFPASASAQSRLWYWLPHIKEFYDYADTGLKIATDDLPSIFSDSFDLQATERRARAFHPRPDSAETPKVDGDRVFSPDPATRARAREDYAERVAAEGKRVTNMRAHRDRLAEQLRRMEERYEGGVEMMRKLPDLIDMSARIPVVNETMPTELAGAQLDGDQNLRTLAGVIDEYRRIVREFDRLIDVAKAAHEAHVQTLKTIEVIQGNVPVGGARYEVAPKDDLQAAAPSGRSPTASLSSRIAGAVGSTAGPTIGRASGLSYSTSIMQQRAVAMAPRGSGSASRGGSGSGSTYTTGEPRGGRTDEPAWRAYMTPMADGR